MSPARKRNQRLDKAIEAYLETIPTGTLFCTHDVLMFIKGSGRERGYGLSPLTRAIATRLRLAGVERIGYRDFCCCGSQTRRVMYRKG